MSDLAREHSFRAARRDETLAVLDGFHAIKHALRFGAELLEVVATDVELLEELAAELAPDLAGRFREIAVPIDGHHLARLGPHAPRTGAMAIARRPEFNERRVLETTLDQPIVLLEEPRNLGNLGACVRVAAAADAAGLMTIGVNDPWNPDALRGAAGLHYALPVGRVAGPPRSRRALLAIDPEGDPLRVDAVPPGAILAFGTERYGLSDELKQHASGALSIPMRPGVSSLNLATTVSAVLFAMRLLPAAN